jgi:hypothetical protein
VFTDPQQVFRRRIQMRDQQIIVEQDDTGVEQGKNVPGRRCARAGVLGLVV